MTQGGGHPCVVQRIDWFRVLMDLKQAGLSLHAIAALVGVSKTAVIGWKNHDAEPGHTHGERVLMLWERATGKGRADAPRARDLTTIRPGEQPLRRIRPVPEVCPCCGDTYMSQVKGVAKPGSLANEGPDPSCESS